MSAKPLAEATEALCALADVLDAMSEPDASDDLLTQAQLMACVALAAVCRVDRET